MLLNTSGSNPVTPTCEKRRFVSCVSEAKVEALRWPSNLPVCKLALSKFKYHSEEPEGGNKFSGSDVKLDRKLLLPNFSHWSARFLQKRHEGTVANGFPARLRF